MKYGFTVPNRGPLATPEALGALARRGEELGFDSIQTGDHIIVPRTIASPYPYSEGGRFPGATPGEAMEQLTLLSFLAGQTQRIRLVTSVIIVPHRNPLVAAKALATLDVLSRGRLVVGVGAGWMKEEFVALGLPPFEERGAVTDEYIRAFKELWTSPNPSFQGSYCSFSELIFLPKPLQKPHPPIWVGGESPRALRRTAELADGWYPIGANPAFPMGKPEQLAAGIKRLGSQARRAGRDPSEILVIYRTPRYNLIRDGASPRSSGGDREPFTGSAGQIASDVNRYEKMGVGYLVLDFIRDARTVDEAQGHMEAFASQVRSRV
jgi:probable F420-dependent oxidoreductase